MKTNLRTRSTIKQMMATLTVVAGCGSTAPMLTAPGPAADRLEKDLDAAPAWVRDDCRAKMSQPGLCAVGVVAGIRNPSLARDTAELRGQAGIARQINALVEEVTRDFEGAVSENEHGPEGLHAESARYRRNSVRIIGARTIKWWASPTGGLYALVVLEPNSVATTLAQSGGISPAGRAEVMRRADRLYDELREGAARQ
jgi:hypothetical protein